MKRLTLFAAVAAAAVAVTGCATAFTEPVMKVAPPPAAALAATTARAADILSGPDAHAKITASLPAGASVTASSEVVRGFRRVKTADGKTGYVDAGALTVGAAVAPAAPPAAEAKPAPAP